MKIRLFGQLDLIGFLISSFVAGQH